MRPGDTLPPFSPREERRWERARGCGAASGGREGGLGEEAVLATEGARRGAPEAGPCRLNTSTSGSAEHLQVDGGQAAPPWVRDGTEHPGIGFQPPQGAWPRGTMLTLTSEVQTCTTVPPAKGNTDVTPGTKGFHVSVFRGTNAPGSKETGKEGAELRGPHLHPPPEWAFNPCFPGVGPTKPLQGWGPMCLLTLSLKGVRCLFSPPTSLPAT